MSENKYTVVNRLSHQSKIEDKKEKKKNINNFINFQLNIVRISNSELDELKSEIFESEYSFKHQQITYYLTLLQKLINISQLNFWKFHKKTVQYFVQDDYLFHQQSHNIPLHQIVNQSEK